MAETASGEVIPVTNTLETYQVRCATRNIVRKVIINTPAWECCPICNQTIKECPFIYSVVPVSFVDN